MTNYILIYSIAYGIAGFAVMLIIVYSSNKIWNRIKIDILSDTSFNNKLTSMMCYAATILLMFFTWPFYVIRYVSLYGKSGERFKKQMINSQEVEIAQR